MKKEEGSCEVTRDRISRRVMKKKRVGRRVAPQHQKTVGWIGARPMQEVMAVKEREREREREKGESEGGREARALDLDLRCGARRVEKGKRDK